MRWFAVVLLILALAACGGESAPQAQSPRPSKTYPSTGLGLNPTNGKTGIFIEVAPGMGIDPATGQMSPVFSFGP